MNNKYLYRIYRLRRLIIVSLIVLFAQWVIGWWLFGPSALLGDSLASGCVALICITVIMALVLTYPRVWWETLTVAIVLGFVLMVLPLLEALQSIAPEQNRETVAAWMIFGVAFGGFFFWLGLNWLPTMLEGFRFGTHRMYSRVRTDIPPDEAFQILKSTPDSYDDFAKSGPVGENGLFLVNCKTHSVNLETYEPEVEILSYYCRIEQESDCHQVISVYQDVDGDAQVDLEHLSVRRAGRKTVCETRTLFGQSNIHSEVGFWLTDYAGDHMYGRLMRAQGDKYVALIDLPYTSPLIGLARIFQPFDETPTSGGGPV